MFDGVTDPAERAEFLEEQMWSSPAFTSLPDHEQDLLRRRFGTGTEVSVEEAAPAAAPEPAAEPTKTAATQERREGGKPLKRVFKQYRVSHDGINDRFVIVEDVDVYDDARGAYEAKQVPTKIRIPDALAKRMMEDPDIADALIQGATDAREQLDENGLKLFLDEARWDITKEQARKEPSAVVGADGSVKRLFFKWKFQIGDAQRKEFLPVEDVPKDILTLIKSDKDYWKRPAYHKWFGPTMQAKREDIISTEIERALGVSVDKEGPEMDVVSETEVREDEVEETPTPAPEAPKPPIAAPAPKVERPAAAAPEVKAAAPAAAKPEVQAAAAAPAPKVDSAPAAPAAPEVPKEVAPAQLRSDIDAELSMNIAAYRKAYGDDTQGLAGRALGATFVLLSERYALAKAAIDQAVLFHEIKDAVELKLGLRAEPQETILFTPETEVEALAAKLGAMIDLALDDTDAQGTEIAFMTETVVRLVREKNNIKGLRYVPGVKLEILDQAVFTERIRQSLAALRTGQKKS
jgi:hypothetical protein